MPSITVKNIPEDLYKRLKVSAQAHRRSINSEIIVCIEKSIRSQRLDYQETIARARLLREKTADYTISDEELSQAKVSGRS